MEKHLERALIEVYYALAEFEQARNREQGKGGGARPEADEQAESLFITLRLARWGLETALRGLQACEKRDAEASAVH